MPWLSLSVIVLIFVMHGLSPSAAADTNSEAKQTIQSYYNRMDAAAEKKDVAGAVSSDAPNYIRTGPKGSYNRRDQISITRSFFVRARSIHGQSSIKSIVIHGKIATVVVRQIQEILFTLPDPHTKRPAYFVFNTVSQDTWFEGRSGWVRFSSKSLSEKVQQK